MIASYDDAPKIVGASRVERIVRGFRLLSPTVEPLMALQSALRAYADDDAGRVIEVVAACVVDGDGRLIFDTAERRKQLRTEADGALLNDLFNAANELLFPSQAEVDAAVGECDGDPTSASASS